jgi:mono/diheme cytochrome c family protein
MELLRNQYKALILIFCLLVISLTFLRPAHAQEDSDNQDIKLGEDVYKIRCALCHGSEGNGKGPVGVIRRVEVSGRMQTVYPWDFTLGVFRFRSTPTGCMPKDEDLLRIISNGIPISLMPAHEHIPLEERKAIVTYIKTLSDAWEEAEEYEDGETCQPIAINKPQWVGSVDSIARGEVIYKKMKCWECHGHTGAGDGPKATELKDDWGRTMLPFNFTSGELKRGSTAKNVYVTFSTGLDGTGMPSYLDSLDEDSRWHLVSYTLKLMKKIK